MYGLLGRYLFCLDGTIFGWNTTIWKFGIWGCTNVQIKFLAMHVTNQKLSFDIFMVGNLQNIFMEHDLYLLYILMYFGIK